MGSVHKAWGRGADALRTAWPTVTEAQTLPEWDALRRFALSAFRVFAIRVPMPEDREVECASPGRAHGARMRDFAIA